MAPTCRMYQAAFSLAKAVPAGAIPNLLLAQTVDSRMIFQLSKMHQAIPEVWVPQNFSGSDSGKSLHISELSAKFCCSPQRWSF